MSGGGTGRANLFMLLDLRFLNHDAARVKPKKRLLSAANIVLE